MRGRSVLFALSAVLAATAGAAAAAPAQCKLMEVAEMPVTMRGSAPVITAKVNGVDARLVADTGSFFSMLTPDGAAKFGLRLEPLPGWIEVGGATGRANVHLATAKDFAILGFTLHGVDFMVMEHELGAGADGLLGENVMSLTDAEFDLANGVIRLFKTENCDQANLAYWNQTGDHGEVPIQAIAMPSYKIHGWATVNGHRIRVLFDTGAWRSTLKPGAAKAAGLALTGPGVLPGGATGGIGRKLIDTEIVPVADFSIGGEEIKNTHLRIGDLDIEDADMLVGADFFLSHRVFISKSQNKIFFTYNGGPVFSLDNGDAPPAAEPPPGAPPPASAPPAEAAAAPASSGQQAAAGPPPADPNSNAPTDAAGFVRRASAFVARHEYDQAVADLSQAIVLEPNDPRHFVERGLAYRLERRPLMAMADFGAALKLKPDDAEALMARGNLRLDLKDEAGSRADFDALLKLHPHQHGRIAAAYVRVERFDDAVAEYDSWIAAGPTDGELAEALTGRCQARAFWNHDLDKALADCDQADKLSPNTTDVLSSRGFVHLRLAQLDPAMSDFNAALRASPQDPWSLYGRGLVKQRKGQKADGDADIAAATAIMPRLPERAKTYGLTP